MKKENVKIWVNDDLVYNMIAPEPLWRKKGGNKDLVKIWNLGNEIKEWDYYIDNSFLYEYDYSKDEIIRIFEKLLFYMRMNNTEDYYTKEDYKTIESIINSIDNLL